MRHRGNIQCATKQWIRTSFRVTCASWTCSLQHIPLNVMRFFLPQVRAMQLAAFSVITLCCDEQSRAKLHTPHLREQKPHVLQRNMQPRVWSLCE